MASVEEGDKLMAEVKDFCDPGCLPWLRGLYMLRATLKRAVSAHPQRLAQAWELHAHRAENSLV